jgi:hypothetical protein
MTGVRQLPAIHTEQPPWRIEDGLIVNAASLLDLAIGPTGNSGFLPTPGLTISGSWVWVPTSMMHEVAFNYAVMHGPFHGSRRPPCASAKGLCSSIDALTTTPLLYLSACAISI